MGSRPSKKSPTTSQKDKYQPSSSPQNNTNRSRPASVTVPSTGRSFASIGRAQQPTMNDSDSLSDQNQLHSRSKGPSPTSNKTRTPRSPEHSRM